MDCNMCGACCTEISISSYIPSMGPKPAGVRCIWLGTTNLCGLFNKPERPAVCGGFKADPAICGSNKEEAVQRIRWYEQQTKPKE